MVEANPAPLPPMPMLYESVRASLGVLHFDDCVSSIDFSKLLYIVRFQFFRANRKFCGRCAQSMVKSVEQSSPILSFSHARVVDVEIDEVDDDSVLAQILTSWTLSCLCFPGNEIRTPLTTRCRLCCWLLLPLLDDVFSLPLRSI